MRESAEELIFNYSTISNMSSSQRLEAGNFIYPYLVGLIEGDGWFSVSKKGKYIIYEFGIELSIRDVQLIYKIKEILSVGTVLFRNRHKRIDEKIKRENISDNIVSDKNMVIYRIRNKSHLREIIIPIFDKYSFLTNKQYDYIRFRTLLLSNVIYSKELTDYTRPTLPINTIEFILNTFYFPA